MRLINRTKLSDSALSDLLVDAGRSAGAQTSGVVVQVNPARSCVCRGTAFRCDWVRLPGIRRLKTDCGFFRISLPRPRMVWNPYPIDALECACKFFRVARHEWGHIRDYQEALPEERPWSKPSAAGRRKWHDRRPEEIRADDFADSGDERGLTVNHYYENVLALAIAIEEK